MGWGCDCDVDTCCTTRVYCSRRPVSTRGVASVQKTKCTQGEADTNFKSTSTVTRQTACCSLIDTLLPNGRALSLVRVRCPGTCAGVRGAHHALYTRTRLPTTVLLVVAWGGLPGHLTIPRGPRVAGVVGAGVGDYRGLQPCAFRVGCTHHWLPGAEALVSCLWMRSRPLLAFDCAVVLAAPLWPLQV